MALEYHKSYARTIILLFVLVLVKRYLTDDSMSPKDVIFLLSALGVFILLTQLYTRNDMTRRVMPYFIAVFSYFAHTTFIFKQAFDLSVDDPSQVQMTKDQMFRHIIQFTSMSLNLVYICIFIITSRMDCFLVNSIVWSMFIRDTLIQPGKNIL
jgi:hypothetical protein